MRVWYDYVKSKYMQNARLCYMDTCSFVVYIKIDDIYADIGKCVEARSDTSNYELERPLPKAKHKKVIGVMRDGLGGKRIKEFTAFRAKTYN